MVILARSDIAPLGQDGVPLLGLQTVRVHYFDRHHTNADTLDKVNPQDFPKMYRDIGGA
jgi:hypothetical protein